MTQQEAIGVLAELRKALRVIDQMAARRAFTALMCPPGIMTTAMQRAAEAGNAIQTLHRTFDEIEAKGVQFPPN